MSRKTAIFGLLFLVVVFLLSPPIIHLSNPFTFNQFIISRLWLKYSVISLEDFGDTIHSLFSSGLNIALNSQLKQPSPEEFNEPEKMFDYIFSYLPTYAVVYPTEQFYYFVTNLDSVGEVSGNIRVADLDKGKISFVYFKVGAKFEGKEDNSFKSVVLTDGEGVEIEKVNDSLFKVTYAGKTVSFKIPDYVNQEPSIEMLPEEKFIGRIMDESGTGLLLFFNNKTNSFYEVLDEDYITDRFSPLDKGFIIGNRTGFIYFDDNADDYKRKILVGVDEKNARANNFLDGPGDHVPIHINFKSEMIKAYPSVLLGAGLDDYGITLGTDEWSRFVVGPFNFYENPEEIVKLKSACLSDGSKEDEVSVSDKSIFWTCLTKEDWNTKEWRERVEQKLKKEGKYDSVKERGLVDE